VFIVFVSKTVGHPAFSA